MLTEPKRYRAFCTDHGWEAERAWTDADRAYEDLSAHLQYEHAWEYGVREVTPETPSRHLDRSDR